MDLLTGDTLHEEIGSGGRGHDHDLARRGRLHDGKSDRVPREGRHGDHSADLQLRQAARSRVPDRLVDDSSDAQNVMSGRTNAVHHRREKYAASESQPYQVQQEGRVGVVLGPFLCSPKGTGTPCRRRPCCGEKKVEDWHAYSRPYLLEPPWLRTFSLDDLTMML